MKEGKILAFRDDRISIWVEFLHFDHKTHNDLRMCAGILEAAADAYEKHPVLSQSSMSLLPIVWGTLIEERV